MLPLLTCSWLEIDLNILVIIYLRLIFCGGVGKVNKNDRMIDPVNTSF